MLLLIAALLAADGSDLPVRLKDDPVFSVPVYAVQGEGFRIGITLAAQARVSLPLGAAEDGTIVVVGNTVFIENRLDYTDLFNPGYGFTLEADLTITPDPRPGVDPRDQSPTLGPYLAVGCDWYGGSTATTDAGVRVRPDLLKIPTVFVGIKGSGVVEENFYGNLRAGMGAVHYPSLMADFQPIGRGELFSESWEFAMEVRMHFGWKLGPLGLTFGMGGRLMAPPQRGVQSTIDPGILWTIDFEFGAELGF